MTTDLIRYDLLVQGALRGVVKDVLDGVARQGLPGDHHCLITFRTTASGVRVSTALRQRFPEEMTVVLQHQFWGLDVNDHGFEVGLHFAGVPETIHVPFDAVIQYDDPSVGFRLRFEAPDDGADMDTSGVAANLAPAPPPTQLKSVPATRPAKAALADRAIPRGAASEPLVTTPARTDGGRIETPLRGKPEDPKIISIDAFRKKP